MSTAHPRRRQILLVLCLSLLVVVIDNTILNTALPTLARVLHAGTSSLQWITDAYTLCFAALLIPAGALGDQFGRRRSLVGGLAVFALGSAAAAFAPGTGWLIAARVVMGLGAAFVMPATLSILNAVFPPAERPQAIAAWSAVAGVGIVIGPTLGGLLLSHFWWGSVFLINVPLVALAVAGVVAIVPETAEPSGNRIDLTGILLVAGALVAIVDAIIEAPDRGWLGTVTLGELGVGVVALGVFCWWELRTGSPLIDLRIFTSRAFTTAAASVTVIFFALFGSLFLLTQYLQLVHGYSPLSAGVRALPFAAAMGLMSPLSPVLAARFGARVVVPAGLAFMGAGLLDLSTVGVATSYPPLAVAVAVMGAGMGLVMAPASATIMTTVPASQAGAGSAINDTIREVGGALGVAIVGSISAAAYRAQLGGTLAVHHVPAAVTRIATGSVAAADLVGQRLGGPGGPGGRGGRGGRGGELVGAAHSAFVSSMALGIRVAAGVALVAAVAAMFALPRRRLAGAAGSGEVALQLEQAHRDEFVGDQDVEELPVQRAQDGLGLVQASGHGHNLRDLAQVGEVDPDPAFVDRQVDHLSAGVEELAEDVADHAHLAQPAGVGRVEISHRHDCRVGRGRADADQGLLDAAGLLEDLLDGGFGAQRGGERRRGRDDRGRDDRGRCGFGFRGPLALGRQDRLQVAVHPASQGDHVDRADRAEVGRRDDAGHGLAPADAQGAARPQVGAHELGAAQAQPGVQDVMVGGFPLVVGHHQGLGQAEGPAEFPAQLERVQVLGVEVDRDQADPAGALQHPADRGPRHRETPGDLVLGELVLVVEPGHAE
jgi:EmrB/QacA subfamily drug resistance transporter